MSKQCMVERLNYSAPPPGYRGVRLELTYVDGDGREVPGARAATDDAQAVAAAWAHCKRLHDPPGLRSGRRGGFDIGFDVLVPGILKPGAGGFASASAARAAAWAWYDDALEVARLLDDRVSVLEYGDNFETVGDEVRRLVGQRVETTIAGLPAVVGPMLFCDYDPNETDDYEQAEVQDVVDQLLEKGVATFEGDAPIELVRFKVWPEVMAWAADQRAAVRRWATEGGEMPEVLRAG